MPDNRIYRPDFTLNIAGEQIYVEYFGMSNYQQPNSTYDKIRQIKEDYHRKNHTRFIALDYQPGDNLLARLEQELIRCGFKLNHRSMTDVYQTILQNNQLPEIYRLCDFFYDLVDTIKSSIKQEYFQEIVDNALNNGLSNLARRQYEYLREFLLFYRQKLLNDPSKIGFDYSDMIYVSKRYLQRTQTNDLQFEHVIIDEYQDISLNRYELTEQIVKQGGAKLLAIGDDWQTIYSFAGSKIEYIYDFQRYFKYSKNI